MSKFSHDDADDRAMTIPRVFFENSRAKNQHAVNVKVLKKSNTMLGVELLTSIGCDCPILSTAKLLLIVLHCVMVMGNSVSLKLTVAGWLV